MHLILSYSFLFFALVLKAMIKVDTEVETERDIKTKWTREKLGNECKEKARK